ncbi:unnamed protein product [Aphanomyces euteiches]|uniref:Uncharacterized protein n=1 Tax=Aphanomyces euteiches TaxID=100861 RepID=A0A6G0X3Z2_9STRA|nr:hypothetical protein Ae201684_008822 [Aphanomyces euteiches]KAH9085857.1 hypothetical protein Ae201684P_005555 [Aphanomyces euteiches]KAH9157510.1 hypothetical protein AeRB84_000667 [Aphanomyces euteiches]
MGCTRPAAIACVASVLASLGLVVTLRLPLWGVVDSDPQTIQGVRDNFTVYNRIHVGLFSLCLESNQDDIFDNPRQPNGIYTCADLSSSQVYQLNCSSPSPHMMPTHCFPVRKYTLKRSICDSVNTGDTRYLYNWHALTLNQRIDSSDVAADDLGRYLDSACGKTGDFVAVMGSITAFSSLTFTSLLLIEAISMRYDVLHVLLWFTSAVGTLTAVSGVVFFVTWGYEVNLFDRFEFSEASYISYSCVLLNMMALAATRSHSLLLFAPVRRKTVYKGDVYIDPKTNVHVLVENDATEVELRLEEPVVLLT